MAEAETQAGRRDWLLTLRQSAPVAWRVARRLKPTHELRSLEQLDDDFVRREHIAALLWDVDGTLTHYHARKLAPEVEGAASRLFALPGLRHAIVSNCDEIRFQQLGEMFPNVPILKLYDDGDHRLGRSRLHGTDHWTGDAALTATGEEPRSAAGLRPVRKPSAELVHFALRELEVEPSAAVMVGDQYWTDVAGANLAGVRSVRIRTVGRRTFPRPLRWLQRVEEGLRHVLA